MYVKNKAGQELRGYMLPPANYVQGRKYPAILDVHGGPKCAYGKEYIGEKGRFGELATALDNGWKLSE